MEWFGILGAVRDLCPKIGSAFTAKDLNKLVKFPDTEKCTGDQIASAWICKFVKWGYAEKAGTLQNPGHKPLTTYTLTKVGREAELELSDLDQLRDAVRAYEVARNARQASMGKKGEATPKSVQEEDKAFLALLDLCNKLDREEFGVE